MTRDEAIIRLGRAWREENEVAFDSARLIDCLVALDVLKLDESKSVISRAVTAIMTKGYDHADALTILDAMRRDGLKIVPCEE